MLAVRRSERLSPRPRAPAPQLGGMWSPGSESANGPPHSPLPSRRRPTCSPAAAQPGSRATSRLERNLTCLARRERPAPAPRLRLPACRHPCRGSILLPPSILLPLLPPEAASFSHPRILRTRAHIIYPPPLQLEMSSLSLLEGHPRRIRRRSSVLQNGPEAPRASLQLQARESSAATFYSSAILPPPQMVVSVQVRYNARRVEVVGLQ